GTSASDVITLITSTCDVKTTGKFDFIDLSGTCGSIGTGNVTDVFISEVYDSENGSLSYIEIFNGTASNINLANYEIRIRTGTSTDNDYPLTGTINSGATRVMRIGGGATLCPLTPNNSYP